MQSLSENSMDMIMRLSLTGQFFYVNPVVENYIGCMANQLLNKSLSEVTFTKALHSYMERTIHEQKLNPSKSNEELSIPVRVGEKLTERILKIDAIPEYTDQELETILFVGHDITESKRIEKEIQVINKNIQDSINYAEKIQTALLPEIDNIRTYIPRSFVYYQPRDVVSGDFPWFFPTDDHLFIAAVDCTGHGVPGALLSFIAFFLMKEVIDKNKNEEPGKICDILHEKFRETLKQTSRNADARDGFDIALCKIGKDHKKLQFAGAHRPLYHLSSGELNEYKGDRKSIGGIPLFNKSEIDFTSYTIDLNRGDKIFLFSDGLTDQLGGPYGRKYTPQRLREVILSNPGYTMQQFNDMFVAEFENWKTGFKQLDDVLVIGVEF
jgi:PAS domain S-box-containing protein